MAFRFSFEEAIVGSWGLWQTGEHTSSNEVAATPEQLIAALKNLGFDVARIFHSLREARSQESWFVLFAKCEASQLLNVGNQFKFKTLSDQN